MSTKIGVSQWRARDGRALQPIRIKNGIARFVENKIVRTLLEEGTLDLNRLAVMGFSRSDQEQFAQLIGYSVSGFGDLGYAQPSTVAAADEVVERMLKRRATQ